MDELEITENVETQEVFVKSPKRQEKIIIYKPWDRTSFFSVRYESGKEVPTCTGQYTSRKLALSAVKNYLINSKATPHRKQNDIFGPEKPVEERPTLKYKKVRKTKSASESNTEHS